MEMIEMYTTLFCATDWHELTTFNVIYSLIFDLNIDKFVIESDNGVWILHMTDWFGSFVLL